MPVVAFWLNPTLGKSAPFKRNQMLINLAPVEVIVCEGSGIQVNLADRTREAQLPLTVIRKSECRSLAQRAA